MTSRAEVLDLVEGLHSDVRIDGRRRREWRHFTVQLGVAPHAQGSAMVTIGKTQVIVGITCHVGEATVEGQGTMRIDVDASPNALKVNSRDNMEITRQRYALSSAVANVLSSLTGATTGDVDADPLTRVEGVSGPPPPANRGGLDYAELYVGSGHCFNLQVDVTLLTCDGGNVFGCASYAVKAALMAMKLPHVTVSQGVDGSTSVTVDPDPSKAKALRGTRDIPIAVVLCLYGGFYLVDPSYEEEVIPTMVALGVSGDQLVSFAETIPSLRPTAGVIPAKQIPGADLLVVLEEGALVADDIDSYLMEAVASQLA